LTETQRQAKAEGRYKGRPEDAERNDGIARLLDAGQSWGSIQRATGCSRATIAKIAKRFKQQAARASFTAAPVAACGRQGGGDRPACKSLTTAGATSLRAIAAGLKYVLRYHCRSF